MLRSVIRAALAVAEAAAEPMAVLMALEAMAERTEAMDRTVRMGPEAETDRERRRRLTALLTAEAAEAAVPSSGTAAARAEPVAAAMARMGNGRPVTTTKALRGPQTAAAEAAESPETPVAAMVIPVALALS